MNGPDLLHIRVLWDGPNWADRHFNGPRDCWTGSLVRIIGHALLGWAVLMYKTFIYEFKSSFKIQSLFFTVLVI